MKVYEVLRKGGDPGEEIKDYSKAVETLVARLPINLGKGYEFKRRGNPEWRKAKGKPALKSILLDKTLRVGEAFYARRANRAGNSAIFVLRAVEAPVNIPDCPVSGATAGIKSLWDATYRAYLDLGPGFEFVYMGGFVCRRIDGSSTWSQHAFSNAFDFRIRKAGAAADSIDTEATTKVVNKVKDQAAEALWLVSGHFYHAHMTGSPKRFGTPGCA